MKTTKSKQIWKNTQKAERDIAVASDECRQPSPPHRPILACYLVQRGLLRWTLSHVHSWPPNFQFFSDLAWGCFLLFVVCASELLFSSSWQVPHSQSSSQVGAPVVDAHKATSRSSNCAIVHPHLVFDDNFSSFFRKWPQDDSGRWGEGGEWGEVSIGISKGMEWAKAGSHQKFEFCIFCCVQG